MFKKGNKGITLIALVITIIVLLILAGITIAQITGQDSAPEKAAQAKVENERGAAKDAATMLVTEKIQGYYEEKYEKTPATTIAANQLEYIAEKLGSGVTTGDYTVTVTTAGGITVKKGTETMATGTVSNDGVITWDGTATGGNTDNTSGGPTVVGGIETIQIGDSVNYNPGNLSTASVELPEGAEIENTKLAAVSLPTGATLTSNVTANQATDWKVLNVTEDGDVIIIPTRGTLAQLELGGKDGYNNGIAALDVVSSIYLNPTYAKQARSITSDDILEAEDKFFVQVATPGWSSDVYHGSPTGETNSFNHRYGIDENGDIVDAGTGNTAPRTFIPNGSGTYVNRLKEILINETWVASRNIINNGNNFVTLSIDYVYENRGSDLAMIQFYNPGGPFGQNLPDRTEYHSYTAGVNPVVYLKSGVTMEKDGNGVWQLSVE